MSVDSTKLPVGVTTTTIATCLALGATAFFGSILYAGLVLALSVVLALGWPTLLNLPHASGCRIAVIGGAAALTAAVVIPQGDQPLRWLPLALAAGMMLAFVTLVPGGRLSPQLVEAAAGAMGGITVAASGIALAPTVGRARGAEFVVVALAGIIAGAVAELSGRHPKIGALAVFPVMVTGGLVGWLIAHLVGVNVMSGLGLGMLMASFSYSLRRMFGAVIGVYEGFGQVALAIASVLLPGILVVALAQLSGI